MAKKSVRSAKPSRARLNKCPRPRALPSGHGCDPFADIVEKLCELIDATQVPVGIELGSIEVGCIADSDGNITGKVYMCIVKDEADTTTTTELKAINYADGVITAPYTGPISPCNDKTCPPEVSLGVITDLSSL